VHGPTAAPEATTVLHQRVCSGPSGSVPAGSLAAAAVVVVVALAVNRPWKLWMSRCGFSAGHRDPSTAHHPKVIIGAVS
jgi:hypothetical protein